MNLGLNVRRELLFLFFYTVLCTIGLINVGAVLGYTSVTLPVLSSNMSSITLNAMERHFFVSIPFVGQCVGCFLCLFTLKYGRRFTMIIFNVIFCLGWSLIASSYNVAQLFVGMMLTGIGMGLSVSSVVIYLEEISITSWREIITITPNIAIPVGILIIYFLGYIIQNQWRLMAIFWIVLSISSMLCNIFFIYESPVWLLSKGRKEAARKALIRIRGLRQETKEFQEEFAKMVNYIESSNFKEFRSSSSLTEEIDHKSSLISNIWSKLKNIKRVTLLPEVWKPFVILNLYFFFQRFSGLYVLITYTIDIIVKINITMDPFFVTVMVGITQMVGSVIAACCSRRIGRRTISIVSGAGISISLGALAVYLQFFEDSGVTAVPLVCILIYMAFGSFGFIPLPWSMIGELYPTKYINVLGLVTTFNAIVFNCIAIRLYPTMVTQNKYATIYFYCIISVIATFFLTVALPETRGKTKTQMEEVFRGKLQSGN